MLIKTLYILFIALLVATFVGVGIQAFYPPPKAPQPPMSAPVALSPLESTQSAKLLEEQKQNQAKWVVYQEQMKIYNKNVSMISLVSAVIILVLSLTLFKIINLIGDGLLLGSVFTLTYSIFRGFESQDDIFRFIVVSISLAVALFIGYIKFLKLQR